MKIRVTVITASGYTNRITSIDLKDEDAKKVAEAAVEAVSEGRLKKLHLTTDQGHVWIPRQLLESCVIEVLY